MNREIKFRAWDKGEKQMYYNVGLSLIGVQIYSNPNNQPPEDILLDRGRDCFNIMQYTGLKDKNGVEIYEGDIVAKEQVYHFIDREGWEPAKNGKWIIIGEKVKNFTGKKEEKYVAGYCNIMVIEWRVESAGYEPFSDSMENCGHCGGGDNPADYVVLGNIHQHPELLNS